MNPLRYLWGPPTYVYLIISRTVWVILPTLDPVGPIPDSVCLAEVSTPPQFLKYAKVCPIFQSFPNILANVIPHTDIYDMMISRNSYIKAASAHSMAKAYSIFKSFLRGLSPESRLCAISMESWTESRARVLRFRSLPLTTSIVGSM